MRLQWNQTLGIVRFSVAEPIPQDYLFDLLESIDNEFYYDATHDVTFSADWTGLNIFTGSSILGWSTEETERLLKFENSNLEDYDYSAVFLLNSYNQFGLDEDFELTINFKLDGDKVTKIYLDSDDGIIKKSSCQLLGEESYNAMTLEQFFSSAQGEYKCIYQKYEQMTVYFKLVISGEEMEFLQCVSDGEHEQSMPYGTLNVEDNIIQLKKGKYIVFTSMSGETAPIFVSMIGDKVSKLYLAGMGEFTPMEAVTYTIASFEVDANGHLIVTYNEKDSSGNPITQDLGKVVGDNGANGSDGNDGNDGVGITNVEINEDGELVITLTEGDPINVGKITGENGETPTITINSDGYWCINGVSTGVKAQGEKGDKGEDGTSFLNGNGAPANTLGKDGDVYLDLETYDLYAKSSGEWSKVGNIKGATGENGQPGQNGSNGVSVVSVELTGSEGNVDTYTITLSNGETFTFTITNGSNGQPGQNGNDGQDGQDGQDGTSFLTGHGTPTATTGKDGDTYLDLDTYDLYTKDDGAWTKVGNIKGATGENGNNGNDGQDGQPGNDGQTPYIGENGNWWIGETDTGVKAAGETNNGVSGVSIGLSISSLVIALGSVAYAVLPKLLKKKEK